MLIDYGNKYNENGKNMQLEYSKKVFGKSPSCIAVKNDKGVVMAALKPITSKLRVLETQERVHKICENVFLLATGKDVDITYIVENLKYFAAQYKKMFFENISGEYLKKHLNELLVHFNSNIGLRVLGCECILMVQEKEKLNLYLAENCGSVLRQKCAVIGSMQRRAKTELEKHEWNALSLEEMIDRVVMIFYKCFDPLVDKEFELEVGVVANETGQKYVRLEKDVVEKYGERHCDLTVDD